MVKCIGPKFDSKVCTREEGSNRIREGPVSSLDRSILERSFSSSGSDLITFGGEEILNCWIVIEFPALIHVNILVLAGVARGEYWERKYLSHLIGDALEVRVSPYFIPVK